MWRQMWKLWTAYWKNDKIQIFMCRCMFEWNIIYHLFERSGSCGGQTRSFEEHLIQNL
jgi:hypothetical protein